MTALVALLVRLGALIGFDAFVPPFLLGGGIPRSSLLLSFMLSSEYCSDAGWIATLPFLAARSRPLTESSSKLDTEFFIDLLFFLLESRAVTLLVGFLSSSSLLSFMLSSSISSFSSSSGSSGSSISSISSHSSFSGSSFSSSSNSSSGLSSSSSFSESFLPRDLAPFILEATELPLISSGIVPSPECFLRLRNLLRKPRFSAPFSAPFSVFKLSSLAFILAEGLFNFSL